MEKSESLNEFPKMGRIVPEQKNKTIREVFIYSYRMIYQISNSDVEIVAFVHGARDLTTEEFKNIIK
jgi:toxin ParE1/3/4